MDDGNGGKFISSFFPAGNARRHSGIFIVNFKHISHLVLVFPLLTLIR